jgi:hypothetical protein
MLAYMMRVCAIQFLNLLYIAAFLDSLYFQQLHFACSLQLSLKLKSIRIDDLRSADDLMHCIEQNKIKRTYLVRNISTITIYNNVITSRSVAHAVILL